MKKIGFLSFGHWHPSPQSGTRSGRDALVQSIELAVAGEEIGLDGAYFRVHHFARQLASPFPLLAAIGARTSRIEIGTGVIDMRYENPLYMAEDAAAADLISAHAGGEGRLQLGLSRGSPETALNGAHAFGFVPPEGRTDADMARAKTQLFRNAIAGAGAAPADPKMTGSSGLLPIQPQAPGLADRIWWGAGTRATAVWAAEQGMNLMSSTLLTEDTGVPFDELQAEQIALYREAWAKAGWEREPRVSVSRSVLPITTDEDRGYFGERSEEDQVGILDGARSRFGRSYVGEPDRIAAELAQDAAVQAADTVLVTVPNQLGVAFNTRMLETIVRDIRPALS
ncbi:LLM class flavin-dependent oxidoreductase [Agromyces atrinae]|uniref:Alkanesulfonate monooxygenase SsuD/methylene tetrahydromethanopterin reductase-like flavin-dependent oxidoreductase (Luciferase family) n=1 Tax=Agromyces atrinae TaxID=592376 RepID=A0A852S7Z6_9MICO|nr:LLM class flavin-dependent oxidoreductase [Agromyces atrinae]NYD68306.1 alkanesulfonate monooxygenase SsuD/methylene tetrahydromethanopterin reductase-like flavin-dependent oxidoreductase (luciferase family) [Agromyces atrinae]